MVQLRKVILADHLAESSVSVDNISFVICSGKIKEIRYDPIKKVLLILPSSQGIKFAWKQIPLFHVCTTVQFSDIF